MFFFYRSLSHSFKDPRRHRAGAVTLLHHLANLRAAGFATRSVIDAGALHGDWSQTCRYIFPEARFLLIEPQPAAAALLAGLYARPPGFNLSQALLGADPGHATFALQNTKSRIVRDDYQPAEKETLHRLPVERLDAVVQAEAFTNCNFLKPDIQEHELHALDGAAHSSEMSKSYKPRFLGCKSATSLSSTMSSTASTGVAIDSAMHSDSTIARLIAPSGKPIWYSCVETRR